MISEHGSGKQRVLQAGLHLFAERGFDRVTIRDIGKAAGLSNPALYRHYASKEELGVELYRRCYQLLLDTVTAAAEGVEAAPDRLKAYATAYVELAAARPTEVLFVDEHKLRFWPLVRAEFGSDTVTALVAAWLEDGRTQGAVRGDISSPTLIAVFVGCLSHWATMHVAGLATREDGLALGPLVSDLIGAGAS